MAISMTFCHRTHARVSCTATAVMSVLAMLAFIVANLQAAGNAGVQPPPNDNRTRANPVIVSVSPLVITRGESVVLTGMNLQTANQPTTVELDGQPVSSFTIDSPESITLHLASVPEPPSGSHGQLIRQIVVVVGEKRSPSVCIRQITWGVVVQPRVLFPLVAYIIVLLCVLLPHAGAVLKSQTGHWSLSKAQMGLWTVVFGGTYIILAAARMEFLPISSGMFWLMGISSTTAVGAKAIAVQRGEGQQKSSHLLSEYDASANGYRLSLHRCQIALWTAIIVVIYLTMVYGTMSLPDIPDSMLVLMGISGGTYLGFSYPGRATPSAGGS